MEHTYTIGTDGLVAMYNAGLSTVEISRLVKVPGSTIWGRLYEAGVKMRDGKSSRRLTKARAKG